MPVATHPGRDLCPGAESEPDADALNVPLGGALVASTGYPGLDRHPFPGCLAWLIGRAARKATAGSALFTADGELCAYSKQTWIRLET